MECDAIWNYPTCALFDVPVHTTDEYDYVLAAELDKQLVNRKMRRAFTKLFGEGNTCPARIEGSAMYAWDVDKVLRRLALP